MNDDALFRWVLVAGMALVFPFGLYHRLRAHAQGDRIDRRAEGWFLLLTLRPVGFAGMIGMLCYVIDPQWMAWSAMSVPVWGRWVGVLIGAVGAVLFIVTLRALGTNITDTVVTRARHTLVTTGPYRWVRHPFYVAAALAVVANALVSANAFIAVAGGLVLVLLYLRTPIEERHLRDRFGAAWNEYAARTGRFWPRSGGR